MGWWGWIADRFGRRWSMIIPAALAIPIAPLYLLTTDFTWIAVGFVLQGAFGGALYSQLPSYLSERFPTEVRATASAFCYHQGAIFGGLVPPVLVYFATTYNLGFAIPMRALLPGPRGHCWHPAMICLGARFIGHAPRGA